jgi:hypothetical protein
MEKLSQDKFWAIYETLSEPLKDAIFSVDTADSITNISRLNDIEDVSKIADLVSNVLFGLLPLELIPDILKDDLNLTDDLSKKISLELEHFIFNDLESDLNKLYNVETTETLVPEEPKDSDTYREILS